MRTNSSMCRGATCIHRVAVMPNPLTDELTDEQKAELAKKFAELERYVQKVWAPPPEVVKPWAKSRRGW